MKTVTFYQHPLRTICVNTYTGNWFKAATDINRGFMLAVTIGNPLVEMCLHSQFIAMGPQFYFYLRLFFMNRRWTKSPSIDKKPFVYQCHLGKKIHHITLNYNMWNHLLKICLWRKHDTTSTIHWFSNEGNDLREKENRLDL